MLLRPAMDGAEVFYACTDGLQGGQFNPGEFYKISDYSRTRPLLALKGLFEILFLLMRLKPNFVISTGAAPGLLGLFWGRVVGAKTIWIDSIANAQQLSMSGSLARKFCHVTLTQWEHLAEENGCKYWGSVI